MISFLLGLVVTGIALLITAQVMDGLTLPEDPVQLAAVVGIVGVANGLVGPIVRALSLPLRFLTFGLFGFVLNMVLLLGAAWLAGQLDLGFTVGGFPPDLTAETLGVAFVASAVLGITSGLIAMVVPRR
jgi:putative membrane protein